MKIISFLTIILLLSSSLLFSQVAVNTGGNPPDSSAMLDVRSTTKGFLPPRMSSYEMASITNPARGLMVFNLDLNKPVFFDGAGWSSFDGQYSCGGPFTDSRDGKSYTTVAIGTQCWMAKNLNVGIRIDGASNQSENGTIEKYCYDDLPANCIIYGGLYQWHEMMQYTTTPGVQGICPEGWHLPTDAEWTTLTDYVNSVPDFLCNSNTTYIAKALADSTLWNSTTVTCAVGNNLVANNATGYSGLPGGYRYTNGSFMNVGNYTYWWTSTEEDFGAWFRDLNYVSPEVYRFYNYKVGGFSVRCLRDN